MIDARRFGLCCLLGCCAAARAAEADLVPGQPAMPGQAISLNARVVELTLADAVFLGLRRNRAIRGAYIERVAQKFDLRVEEDRFHPQLALSGRYQFRRDQDDRAGNAELAPTASLQSAWGTRFSLSWTGQVDAAGRAGTRRGQGASFSVTQPLARGAGDAATAGLRLARLTEEVHRLHLQATVSEAITQIITAYRELLRAQAQAQIVGDALSRSRQLLAANRAMIEAGRMAAFEIVQTEADAASQEYSVEEAANQLDASRLELLRLLALDLNTPVRAVDRLDPQRLTVELSAALATARERQPAYLIQHIATRQAEIHLAVARNEQSWDVSFVGGATQWRDRLPGLAGHETSRTWETFAGLRFDIPITDMGRRQGVLRARVEVRNQEVRLEEARQALEREVGNAVRDLGARWRQYEIAQRARELSQRKLQIEREKLQAGRSSNFQVLSFEADLRNAENARLHSLIAYLNAQTTLDQTLGTTLKSWEIELHD
ncbi:MAG: TolC family protein [Candidatus Accumulibacter sp.]|jgi:outer membrane protein TolC|nr:TolC family protein [Accumulibacter sp.]